MEIRILYLNKPLDDGFSFELDIVTRWLGEEVAIEYGTFVLDIYDDPLVFGDVCQTFYDGVLNNVSPEIIFFDNFNL